MNTKRVSVCLLLILTTVSISWSQDLSNYYTAYGFRLPHLESGEYSISLGTNYNKYVSQTDYPDTDLNQEYSGKDLNFTLNGLYAFSSRFLIRAAISYYPSLTRSKDQYVLLDPFGGPYTSTSKEDLSAYIRHGALFVFRPKPKVEIFVDYTMYSMDTDRFSTTQSPPTLTDKREVDSYYVWAGINIIGKL